jgi:hypothetical protein
LPTTADTHDHASLLSRNIHLDILQNPYLTLLSTNPHTFLRILAPVASRNCTTRQLLRTQTSPVTCYEKELEQTKLKSVLSSHTPQSKPPRPALTADGLLSSSLHSEEHTRKLLQEVRVVSHSQIVPDYIVRAVNHKQLSEASTRAHWTTITAQRHPSENTTLS